MGRSRFLAPYLETLAAFGVIVLISHSAFTDQWGFLEVNPHPFWTIAILSGLLYGLTVGILGGALAAVGHIVLQASATYPDVGLVPKHIAIGPLDWTFNSLPLVFDGVSYAVPVLLFIFALIVGEVRQRSFSRFQSLTTRSATLEDAVTNLATRFAETEEVKTALQRRILGQTLTFTSLYDLGKRLETLTEEDIPPAAAEVAAKALEAGVVSVASYGDGQLQVLAVYPPEAESQVADEWLAESPVLRKCLEEGKAASLQDLALDAAQGDASSVPLAIAAPLKDRAGSVVGFILVEKIGFFQFTPAALTTAQTIASWTSQSLQEARLFKETKDRNVEDDLTGAYGAQYTMKRLREEIDRAGVFGFPLSVAVLRIGRYYQIGPETMPNVLAVLGQVFSFKLGPMDLLGRHPDGHSFIVVFPHRSRGEADEVTMGLVDEVEGFGFMPFADEEPLKLEYWVEELGATTTTAEELVHAG